MEDLENARHSSAVVAVAAAKGFDHDKKQLVESTETQIITTPGSLSERIAKRLEAWGVESRGAILFFVFFLKPGRRLIGAWVLLCRHSTRRCRGQDRYAIHQIVLSMFLRKYQHRDVRIPSTSLASLS